MNEEIKKIINQGIDLLPSSAVLVMHHITDPPKFTRSNCKLSTKNFIRFIQDYNNYDYLEDVVQHPWRGKIALTFDDGLEDVYTVAYPFLSKYKIPFTIFIVTDYLDKSGYITTKQLKQLGQDSLVTIGAHGVTHKVLTTLSENDKLIELNQSKIILENIIQKDVNLYAYSHGLVDKKTTKLMGGYHYGFVVYDKKLNCITAHNKYRIPRYNVENATIVDVRKSLCFMRHGNEY